MWTNGSTANTTDTQPTGLQGQIGRAATEIVNDRPGAHTIRAYAGRDVIQGFRRAQDDRIDLATIDADTSANPGNDTFDFIGGQAFHGGGGELRFAGGIVQGDVDGNRIADFEIKVAGLSSMIGTDFVL